MRSKKRSQRREAATEWPSRKSLIHRVIEPSADIAPALGQLLSFPELLCSLADRNASSTISRGKRPVETTHFFPAGLAATAPRSHTRTERSAPADSASVPFS